MELDLILEKYLTEQVFNITINWYGELHHFTDIKAASEAQAKKFCFYGLSKKLNRTESSIKSKLKPDSIKIEKVG